MARKVRNNPQIWEQAFQMFRFDMEPDYDLGTINEAWDGEAGSCELRNNYYDEAERVLRAEGKLK